MKLILGLLILTFLLLSCSRDWNSPLENDSDLLNQPQIVGITEDTAIGFKLELNYSYSNSATMLFERKTGAAYEPITLKKLSSSVFADTTLNMEFDHNPTYRLRVQKGDYFTEYSNQVASNYTSIILNTPSGLTANTIEMQGVRLNWNDNSNKETGYKIERNLNGAGFLEIDDRPANTETYLNSIPEMPPTPMSLVYRVKAYTANLNSAWQEQNVIYSGLGAPTNLAITDSSFYHFTITWTRNSTIATAYQIERKKNNEGYTLQTTLNAGVTAYIDYLNEIGTYTYRVRAKKDDVYSSYTNTVSKIVDTEIPTNGLVAYYPFNGNANDESGNGYNGTPSNGPTLSIDRFGNSAKAYSFDGVDDYIDCGNPPNNVFNLLIGETKTISLWFRTSQQATNISVLLSKDDYPGGTVSSRNGYDILMYNNSYKLGFEVLYQTANYANSSESPVNDWHWHHVIGVMSNSYNKFFLDGVLISEREFSSVSVEVSYNLTIGKHSNNTFDKFNGIIDDLRIYNRALTEPEIQALYHEGGWTGK